MKAACTARPATVRGRAERGIGRSKLEQIARYGVLLGRASKILATEFGEHAGPLRPVA